MNKANKAKTKLLVHVFTSFGQPDLLTKAAPLIQTWTYIVELSCIL